ncbi:MAG: ABC transporter ATP-binding protein [Candidatus Thiodiazotropha sp.]
MNVIVECDSLSRRYGSEENSVYAVNGVSLAVSAGEFLSLSGPSGSGKTTLMNLLSGLDTPTGGEVSLAGKRLDTLDRNALADLRLQRIGFVFQAYNLIPVLSARENVEFIMQIQGVPAKTRRRQAESMLEEVGLGELGDRRPGQLSGGQQQRVAIARAIASAPAIVFADEPSANLDSAATDGLLALMRRLNENRGMTFCIASHDPRVIDYTRRRVRMRDGRIEADDRV